MRVALPRKQQPHQATGPARPQTATQNTQRAPMSSTRTSAGPSARLAAPRDRTGNCTPAKESLSSLAPTAQSQRKARIAPDARYQAFLRASDSVRTSQEVCPNLDAAGGNWQTLRARRKRLTLNTVHKKCCKKNCGAIGASGSGTRKDKFPATHNPHGGPVQEQAREGQTSSGAPWESFSRQMRRAR